MNDRTFAASVLTPQFMREHRETEEQYLKERALLEAAKEIKNNKKYMIEINTDTVDRNNLDAIETRVKVRIQEMEMMQVTIGIDWGEHKPQSKKRHRGWRHRSWKRR